MQLARTALCLVLLLTSLTPAARASDERSGTVADVLAAIREGRLGQVYAVNAVIATPPVADDDRFVIRDRTGSVVIRRDFDWPGDAFYAGDAVRLRCEIGSTASAPPGAYFRGLLPGVRRADSSDAHGTWLVSVKGDESAQVVRLPRGLTALNAGLTFGGLVLLVLAILAWNALLRRLADRRGQELANERLAAATSGLKVEERTRLSVELHDTIAQMLTGVALEIDAARDLAARDQDGMTRHLDLAARTLQSCRNDLRNCMWDLRNQTLDDISMDEAIRRTLAPHLNGARLAVRFDVPREIISDNTALAILRIVRELALNAIRHGRATALRVAGCIEGDRLLFSVQDNGCGFDPAAANGLDQGHFGLQGIAERIDRFEGEMDISSAVGRGTHVGLSIKIPSVKLPTT